jgi:hypothetical protein
MASKLNAHSIGGTLERGLLAPLSPTEELTLRRVALGIALAKDLTPADVVRLRNLALVEDNGEHLRLTALGQRRYGQLPRTKVGRPPAKPIDERIVEMGRALQALAHDKPR